MIFNNYNSAEIPFGLINGVNTVFSLKDTPIPSSIKLVFNGTVQSNSFYSVNGRIITLGFTPQIGDLLYVWYRSIGYDPTAPGSFVTAEVPIGVINGVNVTFILANNPNPVSSVIVYLDGVVQLSPSQYTLSGNAITFVSAPNVGQDLFVNYTYYPIVNFSAPINFNTNQNFKDAIVPSGVINGINNTFTIPSTPNPLTSIEITRNSVTLTQTVDYTISGSTITFFSGAIPQTGDLLLVWFRDVTGTAVSISGTLVEDETPVGTINGINLVFTLANSPAYGNTLKLTNNGVIQSLNIDFTLVNNVITFVNAPSTNAILNAAYRYYPLVQTRFNSVPKISLLQYIRRYLNDTNGQLWPDLDTTGSPGSLTRYINQGELDITASLQIVWTKFALGIVVNQATYNMPANLKSITRITYLGWYVQGVDQTQLQLLNPTYRTQFSRPRWYTLQYEGYYILRLYPGPAQSYPVLSNSTTIFKDTNLQNECQISGYFYSTETNPNFILPDFMARRTIRYYVLWKTFSMEGKGQDIEVGASWKARYDNQMLQNQIYLTRVYASKERQYTDVAIQRPWRKHPPILPPNFGVTVEYW